MHVHFRRLAFGSALGVIGLATQASAQVLINTPGQIPSGNPFNNSFTESVNFDDVDGDGDFDAAFADGGDCCNDQNRMWRNNGGAQGGTVGFFTDTTSTMFPVVSDDSRDVEFVDIDNDGDADLYISNTSTNSNQSNRWWVNMGNAQGGTLGVYTDQTSTRWVGLGGAGSSVAPSFVVGSGGFIDWSCFCAFGDLDNDGDMDLAHSTYGGTFAGNVPSRMFLNDGNGFFSEFNPSGFQLSGQTIANGNPGLWCEGTMSQSTTNTTGTFCDIADTPLGIELGDLDGDFDLDILQGARNEQPRIFTNRFQENGGTLSFRDTANSSLPAGWSTGGGHYEQELGDMDNDGDLDIYGLNWLNFTDAYYKNNGSGVFSAPVAQTSSSNDDNEPEWMDYDNDGDLDCFIAAFASVNRMYINSGAPSYTLSFAPAGTVVPSNGEQSLAAASADVDNDGDQDIMTAEDGGGANNFLKNSTNTIDTHAPRIFKVEAAASRLVGANPTVIRALIYDNESFYITAQETHTLKYSVNAGPYTSVPMKWAGSNVFRGEIPGATSGDICYHVESSDRYGNTSSSFDRCFTAGGAGGVAVYCTAKVNSKGCYPQIGFTGTPTAGAPTGFNVLATNVLNNKSGLFFYSLAGRQAAAFQGGLLCIKPPTKRTAVQGSNGNPPPNDCSGQYTFDFNAYMFSGVNPALIAGVKVDGQYWSRDNGIAAPNNTGLTEGIEFTIQ
ncbi:MAG: VCBS repeat-containing protein [Planctomycetes bacterium]|nr:VCBS repeat-containing protein [Planctomycetota bacterium]